MVLPLLLAAAIPGLAAVHAPDPAPPPVVPFASLDKGMGLTSPDGDYSVGVHMLFATRWEHIEKDAGRDDGFKIILARPALRGVALRKWIEYFVQFELAGAATTLLDAQVAFQPIPELGLTVGQFVTPFSREFLVPPGALLFPDFAPSNIAFRNSRDTGAMLMGSAFDHHLEYWAGAANGNGINKSGNDNAQLEWFGRVATNAIGKHRYTEIPALVSDGTELTMGVNASYADVESTSTTLDPKSGATTTTKLGSAPTTKLGGDVAFHTGPFAVQVEGYARTTEPVGGGAHKLSRGGFAQAGFFVLPKKLELAVRGDVVDVDGTKKTPLDRRFDVGANYYFRENHLKLQLRYALAESPNALTPNVKGHSDSVTLQAQLWF